MPGVNTTGNQSTLGGAAYAWRLGRERLIGGVEFNGTQDVELSLFNSSIDDLTPTEQGIHLGLYNTITESFDMSLHEAFNEYVKSGMAPGNYETSGEPHSTTNNSPYIKLSSFSASSQSMYQPEASYDSPYQLTHYLNSDNEPVLLGTLGTVASDYKYDLDGNPAYGGGQRRTEYDNLALWPVPNTAGQPISHFTVRMTTDGTINGPFIYTPTDNYFRDAESTEGYDYTVFTREYEDSDGNPYPFNFFALSYLHEDGTTTKYFTASKRGGWNRSAMGPPAGNSNHPILFGSMTDPNRMGECVIDFTKNEQESRGRIEYNFTDDSLRFSTSAITINYTDYFDTGSTNSPAAEVMRLTSEGRVGIGTDSPDTTLTVNGTCTATSYIGLAVLVASDDRIKHNETEITHALEILNKLQPKHYLKTTKMYDADFTLQDDRSNLLPGDTATLEHGIIAQDLLEIPEVAFTVKENDGGMMSVDYNSLFVLAIQALKDLSVRHEELRSAYVAKVAQHDNDIQQMMTRLEALESSRISEE